AAADVVERLAPRPQEIHPAMEDTSGLDHGVAWQIAHDGEEHGGFARAGLADHADDLARMQGKSEVFEGRLEHTSDGEAHAQVLDLEERVRHRGASVAGGGDRAAPRQGD